MRRLALALLVGASTAACGGAPSAPPQPEGLLVAVASYDLAAGHPSRFLLGVLTSDNELVGGGEASLRFFYLGERQAEGEQELVQEASARFLPIPEEEGHGHGDELPHGAGVYAVPEVTFDRPGLYRVEATIELGGESLGGRAAFSVLPEPRVPFPGERAPLTENLTLSSDAPRGAIDSRAAAGAGGEIPDPELHRSTIADAIRAGRPVLAVFSTPVYCDSRFCGPITDMVQGLARDYADVAEFVHVEIWRDFQRRVINEAAAEWLFRGGDLQEPWVFLIGPDGRILARWDNVATRGEIVPWLERLG